MRKRVRHLLHFCYNATVSAAFHSGHCSLKTLFILYDDYQNSLWVVTRAGRYGPKLISRYFFTISRYTIYISIYFESPLEHIINARFNHVWHNVTSVIILVFLKYKSACRLHETTYCLNSLVLSIGTI